MKTLAAAAFAFLVSVGIGEARTYKDMFGREPQRDAEINAILNSMDLRQGPVDLPAAQARLSVPADFYYLDATDAKKLLVKVWGNPPQTGSGVLGMIFPVRYAPDDADSWGSLIEYSADGYVSDVDAQSTDYDALLAEMQEATQSNNGERQRQGYEPIKLVGWASPPHYDASRHALHWARDLLFGDDPTGPHTLNYSVRVLGRDGVLEMNFVARLDQLAEIRAAIPATLALVTFGPGKTYGDHVDGDKIAAYGLAGLIAAGAGAKIAAKLGLLAGGLVLFKKFGVVLVVALAGLLGSLKRRFGRKKDPSA